MLSREKARLLSAHGVNSVVIEATEGDRVKVFGNGMVDIDGFRDYTGFTAEELGIKEKSALRSSRRSSTRAFRATS